MNKSIYYIILFILSYYLCSGQETAYDSIVNPIENQIASLDQINPKPFQTTLQLSELPSNGSLQLLTLLQNRNPSLSIMNTSGSPGSSISAIFRGRNSYLNDFSPLIILDGLPIDNSVWNKTVGGTDKSNRSIDINPFDIKSVEVLNGSVGSVIYGIRGTNGVLILTSKNGKKSKPQINIQSEISVSQVGKLPLRQSMYAQGRPSTNGLQYRGPETLTSYSWGPPIVILEYATDPSYPFDKNGFLVTNGMGNGIPANAYDPYVFFQDATSHNLNASVSGGGKNFNYYLSGGRNTMNGFIPKTYYTRNSFFGRVAATITKSLDISISGRYTISDAYRNQTGSNIRGIMLGLTRNTPTFDITNGLSPSEAVNDPTSYTKPDGGQRSYRNGVYDNPYWSINNNPHNNEVDRLMSNITLDYKLTNSISFYINGGFDNYVDTRQGGQEINPGFHNGSAYLRERQYNSNNIDIGTKLTSSLHDDLTIKLKTGLNYFDSDISTEIAEGSNLRSSGMIHLSNTEDIESSSSSIFTKNLGALASVDIIYEKGIDLNFTARQDFSSTSGKNQQGFLSIGFNSNFDILRLASIDQGNSKISKLNLFTGFGRTGLAAPPTLSGSVFLPTIISTSGFIPFEELIPTLERSDIAANPELKPEKTDALEVGIEILTLSNQLGFGATYYNELSSDIILLKPITPSTGYTFIYDNVAKVSNSGIELFLTLKPIASSKFNWTIHSFFNTNKNKVEEIDILNEDNFFLEGFTSSSSRFIEGESYGALWGSSFLRNENDQMIIGSDGFPLVDDVDKVLGDPNPDFVLGFDNRFTIGQNLSFGFLIDIKQGGDMYCGTCGTMNYFGVSKKSEEERNATVVFDGVMEDGTPNTQEVNLASPSGGIFEYYRTRYGFGGILEMNIFDASWIRLRRFNLDYDFTALLKNVSLVDKMIVGIYADNLLLLTDYPGIDPETNLTGNSNGFGLDYLGNPSSRLYGVKLNLSF